MDNKVVQTLARAFVQCGYTAVRFNFRGVGASAGEHDAGIGEAEDMLSVVRQVAPEGPIALAGFSFGAFVTSHVLAGLWNEGRVEKAVLVGTAASRFSVAPCRPKPMTGHWWCTARPMTRCRCRPSWTGRARRYCLLPSCPGRSFLSRTIAAAQESRGPPFALTSLAARAAAQ